ncbi:GTP diphosphokinase [soil metagenome]
MRRPRQQGSSEQHDTVSHAPGADKNCPGSIALDMTDGSADSSGLVERARQLVRAHSNDPGVSERAAALAATVESLGVDSAVVAAAALYPLLASETIDEAVVAEVCGDNVARLATRLARSARWAIPSETPGGYRPSPAQAQALRKMLLAVVADVRLVLVRIADHLCQLRSLKHGSPSAQRDAAVAARGIYAPLASRLGIWTLKWELEDLAFRFLEPAAYKRIANQLRERRADREVRIREVTARLEALLAEAGIDALVTGRPKHLYSIWRKMRRKALEFDRVLDIHAVRVLVDSVADCYAALGVVHCHWSPIAGEFDDYIATPKENAYRSLHTAVSGPHGDPLEIQIRTHEMNEHAELGIAAHWRYKEGGRADAGFEDKIYWLRRLLEPGEDTAETAELHRVQAAMFQDRVYALSPRGDIVDLPRGATPLDFAYHVHSDIGHHCRGAKINGRIVPLTQRIKNGDRVEILTARNATPSRDWLRPQSGYLASSRSRAKVRSWFRSHDQAQSHLQGRSILERELQRLGLKTTPHPEIARALRLGNVEKLYAALGDGKVTAADVADALRPDADSTERTGGIGRRRSRRQSGGVTVEGAGGVLTRFARCCRPLPPELITGYVTLGRGVSIHRADCPDFKRLAHMSPDRMLRVHWRNVGAHAYPVDLLIHANERQGLVRTISALLADENIGILALRARPQPAAQSEAIDLTIEIADLDRLTRVVNRLSRLSEVVQVTRVA